MSQKFRQIFLQVNAISSVLHTVLPSFSIKTPSWLRNLLPMLMNVNLPTCWTETSPSNIFLTRGFLLSVINAASDVCNASLFFSINCAYSCQSRSSWALVIYVCILYDVQEATTSDFFYNLSPDIVRNETRKLTSIVDRKKDNSLSFSNCKRCSQLSLRHLLVTAINVLVQASKTGDS